MPFIFLIIKKKRLFTLSFKVGGCGNSKREKEKEKEREVKERQAKLLWLYVAIALYESNYRIAKPHYHSQLAHLKEISVNKTGKP